MKQILTAAVTALLLCTNGSSANAQVGVPTKPALPPVASAPATPPSDPRLDVDKLTPNQRDYLITAILSENQVIVPEQIAKVKESYKTMPEAQKLQMVKQLAQGIERLPPAAKDKILSKMPRQ